MCSLASLFVCMWKKAHLRNEWLEVLVVEGLVEQNQVWVALQHQPSHQHPLTSTQFTHLKLVPGVAFVQHFADVG
jgi:hypothetical protein